MTRNHTYQTQGGITVHCQPVQVDYVGAIEPLVDRLDSERGALFASSFEYPGRYTRWDIGFSNPPVAFTAHGRKFEIEALNARGRVLLPAIIGPLGELQGVTLERAEASMISGHIEASKERFPEELRSKQSSVFSILRTIIDLFYSSEDKHLGLYGAFGYDLAFQFEAIEFYIPRSASQRDLVLYLPDDIMVVDHRRETAISYQYDFATDAGETHGMARDGARVPYQPVESVDAPGDHEPGEYAESVQRAKESFKRGDLFEVVPGQCFFEPCKAPPSEVFRRLRLRNPAPYGALINLGSGEYLVAASPEMYVCVKGDVVETSPISGTIARGRDAIDDAHQIQTLLNSTKDESELTMCTDVDRNDKSRICEPGSVEVVGRRQIEMYSRLIHTVDHVKGRLRQGYDALDAFLSHTWAVTVTGAPKLWAMKFIEEHEKSPRRWYGGAIGFIDFKGDMNTGLTLRTIQIRNGIAEVRAGATLLYDSDPDAEEQETRLKASALLNAIKQPRDDDHHSPHTDSRTGPGVGKKILLVDLQDSFVHTLANYLGQTGAEVTTLRTGFSSNVLKEISPDLVVLSPGPGRPSDFNLSDTIKMVVETEIPMFGVCLGLQGLVEYFGGRLGVLDYPMHGKASEVKIMGGLMFGGLPTRFKVGRYHSLHAIKERVPDAFEVTAMTDDGVVMAVEHIELPIWAVQFHPESILSLDGNVGLKLINNLMKMV